VIPPTQDRPSRLQLKAADAARREGIHPPHKRRQRTTKAAPPAPRWSRASESVQGAAKASPAGTRMTDTGALRVIDRHRQLIDLSRLISGLMVGERVGTNVPASGCLIFRREHRQRRRIAEHLLWRARVDDAAHRRGGARPWQEPRRGSSPPATAGCVVVCGRPGGGRRWNSWGWRSTRSGCPPSRSPCWRPWSSHCRRSRSRQSNRVYSSA
jgi:hypothetical protein